MNYYMLDTNICSFIMREQPVAVLRKLRDCSAQKHKIVVSAISYAEMRFGAIGRKASPKHNLLVDEFVKRLDAVLPWDQAAVDATVAIKKALAAIGAPIGANDAAIAGHAMAVGAILVTNNTREFQRVHGLIFEDWAA
jgi:tRNA(fMet)-specific endonuclease VapC